MKRGHVDTANTLGAILRWEIGDLSSSSSLTCGQVARRGSTGAVSTATSRSTGRTILSYEHRKGASPSCEAAGLMHNVALDNLFRRDFDIERPTYTNLNRWLTEIISCLMSSRCVSGPLNLCYVPEGILTSTVALSVCKHFMHMDAIALMNQAILDDIRRRNLEIERLTHIHVNRLLEQLISSLVSALRSTEH